MINTGSGSGSALPSPVLVAAGASALVAVLVSAVSIYLQLKNYRQPLLQRMVVRIMLMVPLYAVASLISLFSLEAAFVIDAIRDIYEAFVIYCFFSLLLSYLGGERSLLILLHGRPPKTPPFPVSLFKRELDVSDPHTFLFIKRGIIQYVQIKPILAAATLILKAFGKYNEGDFRANSGYLYISIIYNASICLALYCLAMFWLCVSEDLKRFRPVPKFLCVKGILFFSFWQSILISIFVAAHVITRFGPYTDAEHISVGLNDTLICIEMPLFALAHLYAFAFTDFIDARLHFCARMPLRYALMDAFGFKDVVEDIKTTLRGEGMDYREFEPAEGMIHQGSGRDRRIKAGLRYSKGGKKKYWLPKVQQEAIQRPTGRLGRIVDAVDPDDDIHAPLLGRQAAHALHLAPDMLPHHDELEDPTTVWDPIHRETGPGGGDDSTGYELPFGDIDLADEALFDHCRQYVFGDYNYPVIDVSDEGAREAIWHEEERVLRDERGAWQSPIRNVQVGIQGKIWEGYGAVGTSTAKRLDRRDSMSYLGPGTDMSAGTASTESMNGVKRGVAPYSLQVPGMGGSSSASSSSATNSFNRHGVTSTPRLPTTTPQQPPILSRVSSSLPASPPAPPSAKSKNDKSKSKAKSKLPLGQSPLPPDAVDLVVEDPEAALNEQERERRGGEPRKGFGVIEGLRKVYRRGFSLSQDEGQVGAQQHPRVRTGPAEEVEAVEGDGDGERTLESIGAPMGGKYESAVWEHNMMLPQEEVVVARVGTPPTHIRMAYDEIEDHNPWA